MTPITPATASAYATCEAVTREEARNFHYGIRLLPADRRAALCAVYALARRIDDVGDAAAEEASTAQKDAALTDVRASVAALRTGHTAELGDDPVLVAVADASRRLPIPLAAFDELVDGVAADVAADTRAAEAGPAPAYATFDELVGYCRCVAGSVGRLCLGVFGRRGTDVDADDGTAAHLADTLGIALQQTNILRDVREDLLAGRIYLPADELAAHGVELEVGADGALRDADGGLAELLRSAADRARGWYDEGLGLVGHLDRRSAACTVAMAGIYRRLLTEIGADPRSTYDRRRALSAGQKIAIASRSLAGLGVRR